MAEPMLNVLGILAGAVALWSWGRPRADIVAVLIVLGLMVSGVLTPQESLAGFGDPVAIEAAQTLHVSPEAFAMTVVISCSASFVTPVSSTWNLLVMEPGGYSFGDHVKVGLPLLFLTMLITVTLVRLIYRF